MIEILFIGPIFSAIVILWGSYRLVTGDAERREYLNEWCVRIGERVEREMNAPHHAHITAYHERQSAQSMYDSYRYMQSSGLGALQAQQNALMGNSNSLLGQYAGCQNRGAGMFGYSSLLGF